MANARDAGPVPDRRSLVSADHGVQRSQQDRLPDQHQPGNPWSAPIDDAVDGRAYGAARSATDGKHRYLFGWVPTKEGEDGAGYRTTSGTATTTGLERPFAVEPGRSFRIMIIIDDTIAALYVDGVALNARPYARPGDGIGVDVVDGQLQNPLRVDCHPEGLMTVFVPSDRQEK